MRRPLLPPASVSARPVPAPGRVIFLRARDTSWVPAAPERPAPGSYAGAWEPSNICERAPLKHRTPFPPYHEGWANGRVYDYQQRQTHRSARPGAASPLERRGEARHAMVRESLEPGQSVSVVARRNGINPNQLFHWRKLYQDGSLSAVSAGEAVARLGAGRCPEADPRTATHAGQEDHGGRGSQGSRRDRPLAKMDCALTLVAGGRPVKRVRRTSRCVALATDGSNQAGSRRTETTAPTDARRCRVGGSDQGHGL